MIRSLTNNMNLKTLKKQQINLKFKDKILEEEFFKGQHQNLKEESLKLHKGENH